MTTERRGLFVFRTDDTGTKCAAGCPGAVMQGARLRCARFGGNGLDRRPACIAAESAAREAEVDALRRGYDIADHGFRVSAWDGWHVTDPRIDTEAARRALNAEIERIRRGES